MAVITVNVRKCLLNGHINGIPFYKCKFENVIIKCVVI